MDNGRIDRRTFLHTIGLGAVAAAVAPSHLAAASPTGKRPNVLWISLEDISPDLGCYGDTYADTPNIDKLAASGVRYDRAFSHSGVCAPTRCGIITGMYATSVGGHNMRCQTVLPPKVRCFTEYLREAGYYCSNHSKTDYQFSAPPTAWDRAGKGRWKARKPGQPFFTVINIGNTHESRIKGGKRPGSTKHDPAKAPLPAYHPDTPIVRADWASYYDNITTADGMVATILAELAADGLADDTIVMFWGDHGAGMTRGKRWVYDSGTQVPLIAYVPPKWRKYAQSDPPGTGNGEMTQFIDLAPTVLSLAGVPLPKHMQGRALLGPQKGEAPSRIFAGRDRMDERIDLVRMCRDKKYMYVRNYVWWLPYSQLIGYMHNVATLAELHRLHAEGKLNRAQEYFFTAPKAIEELYDVQADPDQVNNLADDAKHHVHLLRGRTALTLWQAKTGDLGLIPEPIFDKVKTDGDWRRKIDTSGILERLAKLHVVPIPDAATLKLHLAPPADVLSASLQYWAVALLHHTATTDAKKADVVKTVTPLLAKDVCPIVRVAAAEAIAEFDDVAKALPVLTDVIATGEDKEQLYAISVLDRLGPDAKSVMGRLRKAKLSKYTARVYAQMTKKAAKWK